VKTNEDINHENMKNMKYLDAVIAETNRFYQPGNGIILREAQEDFLLGELMVKKGTALVTDSLSNHYS
jgi:cytochrome P450